jgi:hypothetical protein
MLAIKDTLACDLLKVQHFFIPGLRRHLVGYRLGLDLRMSKHELVKLRFWNSRRDNAIPFDFPGSSVFVVFRFMDSSLFVTLSLDKREPIRLEIGRSKSILSGRRGESTGGCCKART